MTEQNEPGPLFKVVLAVAVLFVLAGVAGAQLTRHVDPPATYEEAR